MNVYKVMPRDHIGRAAGVLCDNAEHTGQPWFASFNGIIIRADPGDSIETVTALYRAGGIDYGSYTIVGASTVQELATVVNLMISGRYIPSGGPFNFAPNICQAMVKREIVS